MGYLIRLSEIAGAIVAKAKATLSVVLSSFEAELDAASSAVKAISRVNNILIELGVHTARQPYLQCDNQAMLSFALDQVVVKGARHMELRQWYIKEKIKQQDLVLGYKMDIKLDADKLTKPTDQPGQFLFASNILGHALLAGSSPSAPSATSEA
jgi:hypothetical protein